jgi:pilus assembly protein CpaF
MKLKHRLNSRPSGATAPSSYVAPVTRPVHTNLYEIQPKGIDRAWSLADRLMWGALYPSEMEWQYRIFGDLLTMIDLSIIAQIDADTARDQIRSIVERLLTDHNAPINARIRQAICKNIEDELLGLGPLEPLLQDPRVSDILINGHNKVFVERSGRMELTPIHFRDDAHLLKIIERIVSAVGRRIDESVPMVDARLKDGSRFNAIIPPLALDGPTVSIRRFPIERLKMRDLVNYGSLTPEAADVLAGVVRSRLNVLISGGTGSGKTTMLNVMSGYIQEDERIITIEDAAELQLQQTHVVRLETRPPNVEGRGSVSQRELVKNALRMRPERIILGEVRGDEAFDMLQAMNTGHDGSLATIHANSPRDCMARLESMVAMTGMDLPARMVRQQIASAVHVVVQVARLEDGQRKLISISEVQGMEGEVITLSEIFGFRRRGVSADGRVIGIVEATGVVPLFQEALQLRGIHIPIESYRPIDHSGGRNE